MIKTSERRASTLALRTASDRCPALCGGECLLLLGSGFGSGVQGLGSGAQDFGFRVGFRVLL